MVNTKAGSRQWPGFFMRSCHFLANALVSPFAFLNGWAYNWRTVVNDTKIRYSQPLIPCTTKRFPRMSLTLKNLPTQKSRTVTNVENALPVVP